MELKLEPGTTVVPQSASQTPTNADGLLVICLTFQ